MKQHLLKQASDAVNISGLRHSSNAETQTNRINTMLRTTGSGINDVNGMPTSSFGTGNNDVNCIPTSDVGIDNFHQDTQIFDISDEMDTTAPADTDIDEQVARAKSLADYELRQLKLETRRY